MVAILFGKSAKFRVAIWVSLISSVPIKGADHAQLSPKSNRNDHFIHSFEDDEKSNS